ncbi:MAG: hypothetical protein KKB65_00915 [Nanoarchaeota archaeon]|nr:hypothetical protein [Nanoarchaeota archaeon]MBU1029770.1 hypothetical protein [Nanoarchaeota archaeon]MBU1850448.1 hypothetical protein [Nanoarchaeota archaeon]
MKKTIIEFGGIDGSGKSTQIKKIHDYFLKQELNVIIPNSCVDFSELYPQTLSERKEWYKTANPEEIVKANLSGAKLCNDYCLDINCDLILLDRGFVTNKSSSVARMMSRKKMDFLSSERFIDSIASDLGYKKIEDLNIIYSASINTIKSRIKYPITKSFEDYLQDFCYSIKQVSSDKNNRIILSDNRGKEDVFEETKRTINYLLMT